MPSILLFMLGAYLVSAGFVWGQTILSARLSQRIVKHMREELFDKIVKLPIKYLDRHPHGDVMSRMTNDIENISNTVSHSVGSLVSGLLTIIGTVTMMVALCWQLALISCFTVVLTVVTTKIFSKKMKKEF